MRRTFYPMLAIFLLALVVGACSEAPADPVAAVTLEPSELTLPHGGAVQAELRWQLLEGFPSEVDDLLVFVHLINDQGEVVMTADHAMPSPGEETFSDPLTLFNSALASPLPATTYRLIVGLYRPSGERLPLRGEAVGRMEYAVGRVTVPAGGATASFQFSDTWTASTPGADRQVRALRWLTDAATISYSGSPASGRLLVDVRLPEHTEGKQLLLDEGFEQPRVEVAACDGFQQTLNGLGSYRLEIPVQGPCVIEMTPKFSWVDLQTFAKSSLVLEQLGHLP